MEMEMKGFRYCWTQARALAAETLLRTAYSWMPPSERTPLALALHQYWSEKLAEFEAGKAGGRPVATSRGEELKGGGQENG